MSGDNGVFDLDAIRNAQADKLRVPLPVRFGGKVYQVARPLPISAISALIAGKLKEAVEVIFGEHASEVLAAGLDFEDVKSLTDELLGGQGERLASAGSSPTGGSKSRRTSKATTA